MTRVAVIGAGPYGLSIAAICARTESRSAFSARHWIRGAGPCQPGMLLKSDGIASASAIRTTAERWPRITGAGIPYDATHIPVSLELFYTYALDFQQRFVEDLDDRQVVSLDRKGDGFVLEFPDGEVLAADFIVGAIGIHVTSPDSR